MCLTVTAAVFAALIARTVLGLAFPEPKLIPAPRELKYAADKCTTLDSNTVLSVSCPDGRGAEWARGHFAGWFGHRPKLNPSPAAAVAVEEEEGYSLSTTSNEVRIAAKSLSGVRYAMYTLRQCAMAARGTSETRAYVLPCVEITDAPGVKWRGMHFCWFPELSAEFVEREIRMAAYLKFNYVVLESWGVFESGKHPWYGWPERPMTRAVLARLKSVADDLGVTLVPQLNALGHASNARGRYQKHAVLDLHPERQPLFEPMGGWNWCLSNAEGMAILHEIMVEMHEAFGSPPYFHIGCDEAYPPSCPECNDGDWKARIVRHIKEIHGLFAARGARLLMWHDMFVSPKDERFGPGNGGLYGGHGDLGCEKYALQLPRDIVICDWYYAKHIEGWRYTTHEYFKSLGFEVLACPWKDLSSIFGQGREAVRQGWGFLGTSWHMLTGTNYSSLFAASASAAWGTESSVNPSGPEPAWFGTYWRQMGWDMGVKTYRGCGLSETQITRGTGINLD